jgi:glycosyltransferase involved in cell wall biosynthesis
MSARSPRTLRILGSRGIPAAHGGFETFAERLSLHLVERGWRVIVYCQEQGRGAIAYDHWQGVERVRIPVADDGSWGTVVFDWIATRHAAGFRDLCLTLGYNTAVFGALLRLRGIPNLFNMDGIEWRRGKWGPLARVWFYLNDWAGCWIGDHLIADHPDIATHLLSRVRASKITTIHYGADIPADPPAGSVHEFGLEPGRYLTLIARAEPENSVLEAVQGFSRRVRDRHLAVLGDYSADNGYHAAVQRAAGPEVRFLGPIYDRAKVGALRFHSLAYVHGHRVGGTNPSLVEALAAGNPVIAHDNPFNRWVTGSGALFFSDAPSFDTALSRLLRDPALADSLGDSSAARFQAMFQWPRILAEYERLLERFEPSR